MPNKMDKTNKTLFFTNVVYIEWSDAVAVADWEEVNEPALVTCKTVGFLVGENKTAICVAAVVSETDKQTNAKIHIPKAWCSKIIRLPLSQVIRTSSRFEVNPEIFKLNFSS